MRLSKYKSEQAHYLTGLLERWSELEPGPVNTRETGDDDHWSVDHYVTVRLAGQYENVIQVMSDGERVVFHTAPALVQAAVQEAIHAHSWMFSLTPTFTTNAKDGELISVRYDAMITPTYGDSYRPPVGESPRGYEEASPAEVLLSAYLIALTNFPGETQ